MREWLSGRVSPCQGESRGSESRLPLQEVIAKAITSFSISGFGPAGFQHRGRRPYPVSRSMTSNIVRGLFLLLWDLAPRICDYAEGVLIPSPDKWDCLESNNLFFYFGIRLRGFSISWKAFPFHEVSVCAIAIIETKFNVAYSCAKMNLKIAR